MAFTTGQDIWTPRPRDGGLKPRQGTFERLPAGHWPIIITWANGCQQTFREQDVSKFHHSEEAAQQWIDEHDLIDYIDNSRCYATCFHEREDCYLVDKIARIDLCGQMFERDWE